MITALLRHGDKIEARNDSERAANGDTVLHTFARTDANPAVLNLLLSNRRGNASVHNSDGKTPCQIINERQISTETNPPFTQQTKEHILKLICRRPASPDPTGGEPYHDETD